MDARYAPQRSNVVRPKQPLTKQEVKSLLATALLRAVNQYGKGTVADAMDCTPRTVEKAMAMDTLPEFEKGINLLGLDLSALDELFAYFGAKIVPIESDERGDARLLADSALLTSTIASAMVDGRIDHVEEQIVAKVARPFARSLIARIAAADQKIVA